jgi:3-hydroxyacyl-CoA dehydrogenase
MQLVELIPCDATAPDLLDDLESFVTSTLGKSVVRAKDTPSFIANRVGVFSMLSVMRRAEEFGLGFDVVDALTGPLIGRAKSATYRTADVVGLDTLCHVVATMKDTLASDPWHGVYDPPAWLKALVAKGATGQKTGAGIYTKRGKDILVLDVAKQDYRATSKDVPEGVAAILKNRNVAERFALLRASQAPEARFIWSIFSDVFHYCAVHLEGIAESARDVEWCMRHGYGWTQGPFETWQAAGWQNIAKWVAEDISAGKALSSAPLPGWVLESGRTGVHSDLGSYSPRTKAMVPRSGLPVYARQPFPEKLVGESRTFGATLFENPGVRLWSTGDGIGILSFKSKMHAVGDAVLDGCLEAVEFARRGLKGMIIWQDEPPFCAGANLQELVEAVAAGNINQVSSMVLRFQKTSQAFKYSPVPVVAAPTGLALGGGCEFLMHATRVVAHLETYAGLVEAGVGLLPAGGGCKEFAVRAARKAAAGGAGVLAELKAGFECMAMAKVSTSAIDAKKLGLLREGDLVVAHPTELLHIAKAQVVALSESCYRPPVPGSLFAVAGRPGIATLEMMLVNMLEGHFISEHDYNIGKRMAMVLCGGAVDEGTLVDEDWILSLEHHHFMELCATAKTQERVVHMLKTGKPLRN